MTKTFSLLESADRDRWQAVNRAPFTFKHSLATHPAFEIPALLKLVGRVVDRGDSRKYYVSSEGDLAKLPPRDRLSQALSKIEEGNAWLKLSSLQEIDQTYKDILETLLEEMEDLSDFPIRKLATWKGLTVFVASPNRVTPYHFDHDTNFLFQIRGAKDVYLFDPDDRAILTEEEIEWFYRGNPMAGKFKDEFMAKGSLTHLTPGTAVHHPPLAPHLITNGDNVSVSVSVFYSLSEADRRAKVYQANHLLRSFGFSPTPPGINARWDTGKIQCLSMISKRKPKTQEDLLYSGISRVYLPVRAVRKARKILSRSDTGSSPNR